MPLRLVILQTIQPDIRNRYAKTLQVGPSHAVAKHLSWDLDLRKSVDLDLLS